MIKWFKCLQIALAAVALSACSSTPKERTGSTVDVFPVIHKFSLSFDRQELEKAKQNLSEYIESHKPLLLDNDVYLNYSSVQGKQLSLYGQSYLHSIGMNPAGLKLKKSEASAHFDFELVVSSYKVSVETCSKASLGNYYLSDNGCFSENARWMSIKNPEKMLPERLIDKQPEVQE